MARNPIHTRPAAKGDICVLLESTRPAEHRRLRQHQAALQSRFGGEPVAHVHLTVQRFTCLDPQQFQHFTTQLEHKLADVQPFELTAIAMQTLFVEGLHSNFLKWRIEVNPSLERLCQVIERALHAAGITSLYVPGAISTLVSALREAPELSEAALIHAEPFPLPLFTVETLLFSRIENATTFSDLTSIQLKLA